MQHVLYFSTVTWNLWQQYIFRFLYVFMNLCVLFFVLKLQNYSSDYLVDEGAELSSTTELLLDRTHEQAIVDLMIPSLVLLINLLHILRVSCTSYSLWHDQYGYIFCVWAQQLFQADFVVLVIFSLQETKEQYRNKKLLSSLLQLHREVRLCISRFILYLLPFPLKLSI